MIEDIDNIYYRILNRCKFCAISLNNENWNPSAKKENRFICIICQRKRNKEAYYKNPNKTKERSKLYKIKNHAKYSIYLAKYQLLYRIKIKFKVLSYYSNNTFPLCINCKIRDIRILTIDHINNNGKEDRLRGNSSGNSLYKKLIKNNFPKGYQTMCFNCQMLKEFKRKRRTFY